MQDQSRTDQALIKENYALKQKIKELEQSDANPRPADGGINTSEETYRHIFLNAQTGIWRTDINSGLILDANDCVARFLGYKFRDEILREPFSIAERYVDPEDRKRMISILHEHGQFDHFEARYWRNDGSIIWMRFSGQLIPDKGWIEGVSEDITKEKAALEALQESKEHFEQLFNMCPYGIALSRMSDGLILDVNEAWIKIAGFARDEIIGKTSLELKIFENPADRQKLLNQLKETGFCDKLEIPFQKNDEFRIIGQISARLVQLHGSPHIISTMIDITEQKRIDQEISETKERFEALFSASPQATALTRMKDGLLVDFNSGFTEVLGYTRDEAIGKSSIALNIYANPVDRRNIVNKIKEKGICRNYEAVFRMKNGGTMIGSMSAKVIHLNNVAHIISVTSDITEFKKAEDELKRHARDLEEANTALRVLMNCHGHDQKILKETLQVNINDLVIPYLKKLKEAKLDDYHTNCLYLLETNLGNILSPFIANFRDVNKQMTPQEIQIADLIRKGLNTKEIAEILHASVHTVATHRNNIRKKLALRNNKTNLRSYLMSLQ